MFGRNITIRFVNQSAVAQAWSCPLGSKTIQSNQTIKYIVKNIQGDYDLPIGLEAGGNYTGVVLKYSYAGDNSTLWPESNYFRLLVSHRFSATVGSTYTGAQADLPEGVEVVSGDVEDFAEDMLKSDA